jgi:hypothetical protein
MKEVEGHEDERLSRLIRAAQADADPAVWARVVARVRAKESRAANDRLVPPSDGWSWFGRPVALGAAAAACALTVVLGFAVVNTPLRLDASEPATLTEALIEGQSDALLEALTPVDDRTPGDSGSIG